jgi:short-subunit dehydrogenase
MTGGGGVAWVTGASKGIGRALALRLARDGWSVAASARTNTELEALAAEGRAGALHPLVLDITDASATPDTIAAIEAKLGPIDLAVLNAGTYVPTGVAPFEAKAFRDQFEINVMGTVNGLAGLVPRMTARRSGHIAVVASVAGYRGLPNAAAYGATKAALINMCEALKVELEPHGVAVSVICPGFVKTPLTDKNSFPMPFLISAETAAEEIARGLASGRFEIAFPRVFAGIMKTLRVMPNALFFAIARRLRRS